MNKFYLKRDKSQLLLGVFVSPFFPLLGAIRNEGRRQEGAWKLHGTSSA